MAVIGTSADSQGYIRYSAADSLKIDDSLFTEQDLIALGVTGAATPTGTGGCNISFGAYLGIDLNLNDALFDFSLPEFDRSMFDKVDALSLEVSSINNMLINTILSMECCEIAGMYNSTLVPFFKFFADAPEGGENVASMLLVYAEIITAIRAVIEPLECLVRLVPGNPWFPKDFDYLAWIYGYFKEAKPFLDRILSGELLDIIINPIHNMRVKMQACLASGLPDGALTSKFYELGSPEQLLVMSTQAVRNGGSIIEASLPYKPEPKKPIPTDPKYIGGTSNPVYNSDLKAYEQLLKEYQKYTQDKELIESEISRQSQAQQDLNRQLAITSSTNNVIRAHTTGLCGCIADALGIEDISIEYHPIRTTSDIFGIEGKTINGVTNRDAGVTSKDRPADEPYTISREDIDKKSAKGAIASSGSPKGPSLTSRISIGTKSIPNPYADIGLGGAVVETEVQTVITETGGDDGITRLNNNDKAQKILEEFYLTATTHDQEIQTATSKYFNQWTNDKIASEKLLRDAKNSLNKVGVGTPEYTKLKHELEVATSIYNGYYKVKPSFDFANDPKDQKAISNYLFEDAFLGMFPPEYWTSSSVSTPSGVDPIIANIPFTPGANSDGVIESVGESSSVTVDTRTSTNYFNAGIVKEKGSRTWRNFNKLDLSYNDTKNFGAIGSDKSSAVHKAIFPNNRIGDQATLEYLRNSSIIDVENLLQEFLLNNSPSNVERVLLRLDTRYNVQYDEPLNGILDSTLLDIVQEIANENGYKEGKLWVSSTRIPADTRTPIEYNYIKEANTLFTITGNGYTIDEDAINNVFNNSPSGSVAAAIRDITNASIQIRSGYFVGVASSELKRQAIGEAIDTIRYNLMNNIASSVPTDVTFIIPCTCDNFLCRLLNYIVQYFLSLFERMIQEMINMIIRYLIPDWIRDLLRTLKDFLKCITSVFGIFYTISEIDRYAEELLDRLKGRIRDYPADPCFAPTDGIIPPVQDTRGSVNSDGVPTNTDDGDPEGILGEMYYPPTPPGIGDPGGAADTPINPGTPPIVIHPPVTVVPGDPGRPLPGFNLKCQYLEL